MTLTMTAAQLAQLEREARAAAPRECCGLIEGSGLNVAALHPSRNLAGGCDVFEIDPAVQFRLMRALRGSGRAIIGCYHSHPGGLPEPSPRDASGAAGEGFVWLIAGLGERIEIGAWLWKNRGFAPISIIEAG